MISAVDEKPEFNRKTYLVKLENKKKKKLGERNKKLNNIDKLNKYIQYSYTLTYLLYTKNNSREINVVPCLKNK